MAESYFSLRKRERIRTETCATRQEARSAIFSDIDQNKKAPERRFFISYLAEAVRFGVRLKNHLKINML